MDYQNENAVEIQNMSITQKNVKHCNEYFELINAAHRGNNSKIAFDVLQPYRGATTATAT